MTATQVGRTWNHAEAVRFADAMERVCGMLGAVTGVPDDLRLALLAAKREAYVALER